MKVHFDCADNKASQKNTKSILLFSTKCFGLKGHIGLSTSIKVCVCVCVCVYRVSQEECARLRESVPYVKVYRYNPKHLYPKLNGYGDKGQRKVRSSCGSTYCTCSADALRVHQNAQSANLNQYFNTAGYSCAM